MGVHASAWVISLRCSRQLCPLQSFSNTWTSNWFLIRISAWQPEPPYIPQMYASFFQYSVRPSKWWSTFLTASVLSLTGPVHETQPTSAFISSGLISFQVKFYKSLKQFITFTGNSVESHAFKPIKCIEWHRMTHPCYTDVWNTIFIYDRLVHSRKIQLA